MSIGTERVVVIGAGIGGLAAALDLAARGLDVTVLEKAATPGGKMRELAAGPARVDAGPTVFTMRWVFEELFAAAGASLSDHLTLRPAGTLARHAWTGGSRLDLFSDIDRSAAAIGEFAGAAEARGYRDFCARAQGIYDTLEGPFIRAQRPNPISLGQRVGLANIGGLMRISPFTTLWKALGEHFRDPRLRQLFGRYATYCGSSPFASPATLMLVAHVEREGVWLVDGGMHRLAVVLAALAEARGGSLRYGVHVHDVTTQGGRVSGVTLASGEHIAAEAVIANADVSAIATGLLGHAIAPAVSPVRRAERSLSAVTWTMETATAGFPLSRHNVFFSDDYAAEFDEIFRGRRLPAQPTVYVCAQDRGDGGAPVSCAERLLCLVNAPPDGDIHSFATEVEPCTARTFEFLRRCGLTIRPRPGTITITAPADFDRLFPGAGGALYGMASHGWMASFRRPGARTRIPGLYLAGGSAHPGPGVPMAALSGRRAAESLIADLASTRRSRLVATPGGMRTRSATTALMRSP